MDGATSNFVGVQNSFETAEAGGTGVWGYLGSLVKGRPHCSKSPRQHLALGQPLRGPSKRKSMGCPKGSTRQPSLPMLLSTGHPAEHGRNPAWVIP